MNSVRRVTLAQEVEKLDPLAQPALHHLRAADHFADDRRNFPGAEIKEATEGADVCSTARSQSRAFAAI